MLPMLLLAAAGVGMNLLQAKHEGAISEANIAREQQAGKWQAEDRRAALREALASQRVLLASQGSSPDVGSNLIFPENARLNFLANTKRGTFQSAAELESLRNQKLTAAFRGISGASNSLLSYWSSARETTGAPKAAA